MTIQNMERIISFPWRAPRFFMLCMLFATGCMLPSGFQTAKIIEPGTLEIAAQGKMLYVNSDAEEDADTSGLPTTAFGLPLVDFSLRYGLLPSLELDGVIGLASGTMEGSLKFRFIHSGSLSVALIPAGQIILPFLDNVPGARVSMPVTIDLRGKPRLALNFSPFVKRIWGVHGDIDFIGAAIGVDGEGSQGRVRPTLEIARMRSANEPDKGAWLFMFGLEYVFLGGDD